MLKINISPLGFIKTILTIVLGSAIGVVMFLMIVM